MLIKKFMVIIQAVYKLLCITNITPYKYLKKLIFHALSWILTLNETFLQESLFSPWDLFQSQSDCHKGDISFWICKLVLCSNSPLSSSLHCNEHLQDEKEHTNIKYLLGRNVMLNIYQEDTIRRRQFLWTTWTFFTLIT